MRVRTPSATYDKPTFGCSVEIANDKFGGDGSEPKLGYMEQKQKRKRSGLGSKHKAVDGERWTH